MIDWLIDLYITQKNFVHLNAVNLVVVFLFRLNKPIVISSSDWLIDWLIDRLNDRLIEWLIDWSTCILLSKNFVNLNAVNLVFFFIFIQIK